MFGELALIERIRARLGPESDPAVVLGIGDDAALLEVPPDQQLVISTDTLVAGVHFPHSTAAFDIGWKALAVNLSDLAAMAAQPRWITLNLSLPQLQPAWVEAFFDGFLALAERHQVRLIGGDSTRATETVISVTALGLVPPGLALRRAAATVGQLIYVSGWPGEAAAGLALLDTPDPTRPESRRVRERLDRPTPRVELGLALRGLATAAMDVSDGLLLDLDRLCRASGCGAELTLDCLPMSPALAAAGDLQQCQHWLLSGGDDYELLFTADVSRAAELAEIAARLALPLTCIGRIVAGNRVRVLDPQGDEVLFTRRGYEHHQS